VFEGSLPNSPFSFMAVFAVGDAVQCPAAGEWGHHAKGPDAMSQVVVRTVVSTAPVAVVYEISPLGGPSGAILRGIL
jgi:hypothetical protein